MDRSRDVRLPNLAGGSLGDYLTTVGLHQALSVADPDVHTRWTPGSGPLLLTSLSADEMLEFLTDHYVPPPVVAPWSAGGGLAGTGRSVSAEAAVAAIENSSGRRLAPLRAAIAAGRDVVRIGRERGWGGGSLWSERHKRDAVVLSHELLPETSWAPRWCEVAVPLEPRGVPVYNPLTGTGGNVGRLDLSAQYLQHVNVVAGDRPDHRRSRAWAVELLTGAPETGEPGPIGLYDAGRRGLLSSWRIVLTLHGLLTWAGGHHDPTPWVTRHLPITDYPAATSRERVTGVVWAPLWQSWASAFDVRALLSRGLIRYVEDEGRPVTAADYTLCSDRYPSPVTSVRRFVLVVRNGQSPIALHGDHRPAPEYPSQSLRRKRELITDVAGWVEAIPAARRRLPLPAAAHRRVVTALDRASGGGADDIDLNVAALLEAVGELARVTGARPKRSALRWEPDTVTYELRVAVALSRLPHPDRGGPLLKPLPPRADLVAELARAHRNSPPRSSGRGAPEAWVLKAFAAGQLDDAGIAGYLAGLLCLGWDVDLPQEELPKPLGSDLYTPEGALVWALLPLYRPGAAQGPSPMWPLMLCGGQLQRVFRAATGEPQAELGARLSAADSRTVGVRVTAALLAARAPGLRATEPPRAALGAVPVGP
ncbi:hypothetical protein [Streptomyces sp. SM12]|uniref:hypothetical protein n=1 Tax=Streptomyces sp. SM12 TaxID=1071602 RepID=UPI000CD52F4C|nr:hypothetical protein [Streptomyces sp. SM12]